MMQNKIISIIIPVYKVEQYIECCIDSVLSQTYRNLEVILVDDCTPDKSMEIARAHIEKSPLNNDLKFCYIRRDHNGGLSAARNTGIREAKGEYVYFLDSDDSIAPNTLELLCDAIGSSQMCVAGIKSYQDPNLSNVVENIILDNNVYNGNTNVSNSLYSGKWYVMAWNKLIRRDFLIDNNLFFVEGLLHEDEIWSNILACVATSIVTITPVTYYYRIRANSIVTGTQLEKRINSWKGGIHYLSVYELDLPDDNKLMAHRLFSRVCNRYFALSLSYGGICCFYKLYREVCHDRSECVKKVKPTGVDYIKDANYTLPTICGCVMKYLSLKAIRCVNHIRKIA